MVVIADMKQEYNMFTIDCHRCGNSFPVDTDEHMESYFKHLPSQMKYPIIVEKLQDGYMFKCTKCGKEVRYK